MRTPYRYLMATATMALLCAGAAVPVTAQSDISLRVDRLEQELRAVQRKVFPGADGRFFQPEISAPNTPQAAPGTPASSPVADLTGRVNALESQLATLTGQVEENGYKLRQLEQQFAQYKSDVDGRMKAMTAAPAPAADMGGASGAPSEEAEAAPAPSSGASADRKAKVAAIERPSSGDAAEDGYIYGYRLWTAKFYPEAAEQLKQVAEKYPDSPRASYAQNLLGRAYLDDGKPALAAVALYKNYQDHPDGQRAPDSLVYLGKSLVELKKFDEACRAYDEADAQFGENLAPNLKAMMAKGRADAKCKS